MSTPHSAAVTLLADIDDIGEPPRIAFNGLEWPFVFLFTVAAAAAVIWILTASVAVLSSALLDNGTKPLEAVGIFAIGALVTWAFYHLLLWVLGHAESGGSASGVTFLVVLFAAGPIAVLYWSVGEGRWKHKRWVPGVLVVIAVACTGCSTDISSRTHFNAPHREKPASQSTR